MLETEPLIPAVPWVAQENQRFIDMLRGLDESAWKSPTYCTGWTAADVVAHMTLGARFYAHVLREGRKGRLSMPFGADDLDAFWAYRKREGDALAALPGSERVERFGEAVKDLQGVFERLRRRDLDRLAWHWMRPCPIRSFPGQRLYELLLHEWDIRNRPEEDLRPEALGVAVDILNDRLPFFYNMRPDLGLEGQFRFETERPAHIWGMRIRGQEASPIDPEAGPCDVRLFATGSDIILLTTGRANVKEAVEAGRLRYEGEPAKAEVLLDVLCQPF